MPNRLLADTLTVTQDVSNPNVLRLNVPGLSIAIGKTLTVGNSLTLAGTDGSTLNIGAGGTLGSLAFTSSVAGTSLTGSSLASGITSSSLTSFGTLTSLSVSGAITDTQTIGAVSTDGLLLQNTTAAAAGAQQWSPRLHFKGQGWSTAGVTSQPVDWIVEVQPVQGANPSANLVISSSINGGAYTVQMTMLSGGQIDIGSNHIGGAFNGFVSGLTGLNYHTNSVSSPIFEFNAVGLDSPLAYWRTTGAAGGIQQGQSDAAAPVAQTLQVQSVIAGTTNTAGQNWTFNGSIGTGTGAGGQLIFRTAPAGTTGTTQNALATGLTITAPAVGMQPSVVVGNQALATTATDGFLYVATCAGTPTGVPTAFAGRVPMLFDTTTSQFWIFTGGAWKQPKTPAGASLVTWQ